MTRNLSRLILCFLCFSLFFPLVAKAENNSKGLNLSLGLGIGASTSEYKKTDARVLPLPFIHYEGERFFLRGLTGGIHVFKNDTHELSVNLSYMPQQYDASRSDSWEMRQLDNRYSTLLAGASYSLKTQWGIGKIGFGADILDNSNGFIIDASYTYPFALGPVTLMPIGGVLCTSSQHNDYYYGVSNKESRKSGLKSYEADSGFSSYVGFDTNIDLSENWHIFMNTRATLLSDEITDSPMVDEDVKYSFGAGITYHF